MKEIRPYRSCLAEILMENIAYCVLAKRTYFRMQEDAGRGFSHTRKVVCLCYVRKSIAFIP